MFDELLHPRERKFDISGNIRAESLTPYERENTYSRAILVLFHNLFFPCVVGAFEPGDEDLSN